MMGRVMGRIILNMKISTFARIIAILISIMLLQSPSFAQTDMTPKKHLVGARLVRGTIGGESHDSYVIHLRKGQTLRLELFWKLEKLNGQQNSASFTLSESANFFQSEPLNFGTLSSGGRVWVGKAPKTTDYHIYILGYPVADYALKVQVKP